MQSIYSLAYLRALFDEMSASYDLVNYVTSFGFSARFRRQFIEAARIEAGHAVLDMMCGGGECWCYIERRTGADGMLVGIDLSPGMLKRARGRADRLQVRDVIILEGDALATDLEDASFDRIVMSFGLKTLAPELRDAWATELRRLLRPGGVLSAIEISDPDGWWLRQLYMWYLRRVIPILGWLFLGNPENYRMLAIYVDRFDGCAAVAEVLRAHGFEAEIVSYFHGCATGIVARRPVET